MDRKTSSIGPLVLRFLRLVPSTSKNKVSETFPNTRKANSARKIRRQKPAPQLEELLRKVQKSTRKVFRKVFERWPKSCEKSDPKSDPRVVQKLYKQKTIIRKVDQISEK